MHETATRLIVEARSHGWRKGAQAPKGESTMLHYAIVFFVIALIAAVLGARGVAGLSAQIGYLFVGVAVIFLLVALLTGQSPAVP